MSMWVVFACFICIDIEGTDGPGYDWHSIMILNQPRKSYSYEIDGVPSNFSTALYGTNVSMHHTVSEPYKNSWGIMVTLWTLRKSAAKESSLLPLSSFLQWWTPPQSSTKNLQIMWWPAIGQTPTVSFYTNQWCCHFQVTTTSNRCWLPSLSTWLTNRYFVTRTIRYPPGSRLPSSNTTIPLYGIAKSFVHHQNESAGSVSEQRSSDKLWGGMKGDQVKLLMLEVVVQAPFSSSVVLSPSVYHLAVYSKYFTLGMRQGIILLVKSWHACWPGHSIRLPHIHIHKCIYATQLASAEDINWQNHNAFLAQ